MSKKTTFTVALILIAVFFSLGLLNVLLQVDQDSTEPSPLPSEALPAQSSSSTPPSDAVATIVLILGVDEVSIPHPQLQSLWIAALINQNEYITMQGFSTAIKPAHEGGATLAELFDWVPGSGPSDLFLEAVQRTTRLEPDLVIVLDAQGFARVIDYVGGAQLEGTAIEGERILVFLEGYSENPDLALDAQAGVLEALLPNVAALRQPIELTPLTSLVPQHAVLSMDITSAASLLVPSLPIPADSVFILLTHSTDP